MRRRAAPAGAPRTFTVPLASGWRPRKTFNNVDLPAPLGPRIAENVPGPLARSTLLHSRRSPNLTEAPRVWMTSAEVDASKPASRRVCFIGRSLPRAGQLRAFGAEPPARP